MCVFSNCQYATPAFTQMHFDDGDQHTLEASRLKM